MPIPSVSACINWDDAPMSVIDLHTWAHWLEHADILAHILNLKEEAGAIRAMYGVMNGHWGDSAMHSRVADLVGRNGCLSHVPKQIAGLSFVPIPAGSFGSPRPPGTLYIADTYHAAVTLTHGFWLSDTPVTTAQWEHVMNNARRAGPCRFEYACCAPWRYDACRFISALNRRHPIPGWRFDLPTEAQWEYACRAGTNTAYAFGDHLNSSFANFGSNVLRPVKQYQANAFGLYDMHGGVWELCRDMYVPVPVGGVDPIVTRDCRGFTRDDPAARYVARGGSYSSPAVFCASCARTVAVPANAVQYNIGFRVALVVDV